MKFTRRDLMAASPLAVAASAWAAPVTPPQEFKSDAPVPRQSPEYAAQMVNGKQILFSGYKGKVVAAEFLLTTCPHCQHTAELLQKLYTQYEPQGFQVIGIAINTEGGEAQRAIPQFIKDHKLTFPVGMAPSREGVYEYLQRSYMDRMLMPQMVFIDRKGVIQNQFAGDNALFAEPVEEHLRAVVQKMMKPAAPVAVTRKTK